MDLILTGIIVLGAGGFVYFYFCNIFSSKNPCEKCNKCILKRCDHSKSF